VSDVDNEFDPLLSITKDNEIGIYCFSAQYE
jgi:hypothetical protein